MGSRHSDREDLLVLWRERFQPYVDLVRELFAFLEDRGYGAPDVTVRPRECVIVYRPEGPQSGRANVALYNDLGSEPWVQIVPLTMTRADHSTRTFGLNEAMALFTFERGEPTGRDESALLARYSAFLSERFDELTRPSATLLDGIESRR